MWAAPGPFRTRREIGRVRYAAVEQPGWPGSSPKEISGSSAQPLGFTPRRLPGMELAHVKIEEIASLSNVPRQQGGCMAPVNHLASSGVRVLVAGGMGMRPLMELKQAGNHCPPWRLHPDSGRCCGWSPKGKSAALYQRIDLRWRWWCSANGQALIIGRRKRSV